MSTYTIFGIEEVYDAFDEYEHANAHAPFTVEANSIEEAVQQGRRDLEQWIEYQRKGFWSSGWFTARILLVADDFGNLLLDARESLVREWPFKQDERSIVPQKKLPTRVCFLCYNQQDQQFAERLYAALMKHGYLCWFAPERPDMPPRGVIETNENLRHRIACGIAAARAVIVIVSPTSIASSWVEFEVLSAMEGKQERGRPSIFGLLLSPINTESHWLKNIQRERPIIDFINWLNEDWLNKTVKSLSLELDKIFTENT